MRQRPINNQKQEPVKEQLQKSVEQFVDKAQAEVIESHEPWYRVTKHARAVIGFDIFIFVLFTLLAWFVHVNPITPVDIAITREFQENQSPWLKDSMIAVSFLGNNWLIFTALILLTALIFWVTGLRLEALFISTESIVSSLLNFLIKTLVGRPRPNASLVEVIINASGKSFPSGHVMSYVAFFGLVFSLCLLLFRRDRWWNYTLLIICGLFVALVGPSRIYLGDHWASDVLGGYMFGGLLLAISLWLYIRLKARGILTKPIKHKSIFGHQFFNLE